MKSCSRLATGLLVFGLASAFSQPAARPAFEVSSIRLHTAPLKTIMGLTISGPRVTMEGYTVVQLVMEAYHLKGNWQVSAAAVPESRQSDYYDIVARAPGDNKLTHDDARRMLQTLLADRFKLAVHREMKDTPVYNLVIGKKGLKLNESKVEGDCSAQIHPVPAAQSYAFSGCTIGALVDMLGNGLVDRPVIDQTGLSGKYDFRFTETYAYVRHDQSDLSEISPYSALQDLGLKLETATAPLEVITIDHMDPAPTEN